MVKESPMFPRLRSIGAAPIVSALMLAACQAEPAANNDAANVAVAPEPAANIATPTRAPLPAEPAARYRFTGTEPFWGGTIDGATILYQTPDDQAGQPITATVTTEGATTRYSGTLDAQPFVLKLTPGTCSDGMSDTVYPLHAVLAVRGEPRQGCASPVADSGQP
jgi:uncharacterized membrane protein